MPICAQTHPTACRVHLHYRVHTAYVYMHACMYVCMYAWVRGYQSGPGIATESIFRAPRRAQQCHQTNRDLRVRMNSYTYVCMTKQPSSTRTSYNQHLAALQMHRRTVLRSRQSPIRTWLVNCLHLRLQLQTRYCCSVVDHTPNHLCASRRSHRTRPSCRPGPAVHPTA